MGHSLIRRLRFGLLALCALLFAAGCGGSAPPDLSDAALSSRDVPETWTPADFSGEDGQGLWDLLPQLLKSNSQARLLLHAYGDGTGLHGAATILIEAEEPAALPSPAEGDRVLAPLGDLLEREDALLVPNTKAGDPGAYFAAADMPRPDSLNSRLIRLLEDDYLYSDSAIFTVGPVLAVVTVWYPKKEGPFQQLEELASEVEARLETYVGEG